MMKKLLVLMLVFSMVSTAGAALTLVVATGDSPGTGDYADVGSEYTIIPSIDPDIWIGVYNDTAGTAGDTQQFASYLQFASSSTAPPAGWTGNGLIYQPPAVPTTESGPFITFYGYSSYYGVDWLLGSMKNGSPSDYTGVGTVFGAEFICLLQQTNVEVELYDASDGSYLDGLTVHQIPEPITIALLGLGGLFLRRRK